MVFIIFKCPLWIFIGVAVFTTVHAGIVSADITAFHTVAALSAAFMFQVFEEDAVGLSKHIQRHAGGGMDAITGKIPMHSAGL